MLKLRDYLPSDGDRIASWVTDSWTMRVWSADTYEAFPVTGQQINKRYAAFRQKEPSFCPLTAEVDGKAVGHLILQYANGEKTAVHFGFVIVDPACRGRGYGSRMLELAMDRAFGELAAEKVQLMVLNCNPGARRCYLALGFSDVPETTQTLHLDGEEWTRHRMERYHG